VSDVLTHRRAVIVRSERVPKLTKMPVNPRRFYELSVLDGADACRARCVDCTEVKLAVLLDRLETLLRDQDRRWRDGYQLGYAAGYDVGYGAAEWQIWRGAEAWRRGARVGLGPIRAELEQRRRLTNQPCGRPGCGGRPRWCSVCIRAAHVAQNRARYGTDDRPTGGAA
jgi:hypothetical protein